MFKILKIAALILAIVFNVNGMCFAQDDGGNGGADAGDGAGEAMEADSGGDDGAAYEETYTEEAEYGETSVPAGGGASTTTTTTHVYDRGGYVYDYGTGAIAGAAAGAAAGAVAGSVASRAVKSSAEPGAAIKKPVTDKPASQAEKKPAPQAGAGEAQKQDPAKKVVHKYAPSKSDNNKN
jgi:hypothetical protein